MSDTLTNAHIVEAAADANGFSRKKSIEIVETLLEFIKQSIYRYRQELKSVRSERG